MLSFLIQKPKLYPLSKDDAEMFQQFTVSYVPDFVSYKFF